jgi:hypothetical protein
VRIISSSQNILESMLELPPATIMPQPKPHSHRSGDDAAKGWFLLLLVVEAVVRGALAAAVVHVLSAGRSERPRCVACSGWGSLVLFNQSDEKIEGVGGILICTTLVLTVPSCYDINLLLRPSLLLRHCL